MSLNYGTLKTAVLSGAHRTDLTAEVADFVRECEGMIRRGLKYALSLSVTLDDDDRDSTSTGVYDLPAGLITVRTIHATDANSSSYPLEQVSAAAIRALPASAPALQFCVDGDTIEVRGIPDALAELELKYMGYPAAFSADGDTNDLLTNHETLYLSGSRFYLYKFTQDLELAQGELDTFTAALDALNEQQARKLGGATIAPAYFFGPIFRGY